MKSKNYKRVAGSSLVPRFRRESEDERAMYLMRIMGKGAYYASVGRGAKIARGISADKPLYVKPMADNKKGYDKKDYVPLSERTDWHGKIIKL